MGGWGWADLVVHIRCKRRVQFYKGIVPLLVVIYIRVNGLVP
jgi:hypothetical protein